MTDIRQEIDTIDQQIISLIGKRYQVKLLYHKPPTTIFTGTGKNLKTKEDLGRTR